MSGDAGAITRLLRQAAEGDEDALDDVVPLVYEDLRRIAHRRLAAEPGSMTLDTTALVHEAYLKLVDQTRTDWRDRAHFFAIAARIMRRVLMDYVRRKTAAKRGGPAKVQVPLQAEMAASEPRFDDLLALEEALERLEARHPRMGRVVECRFFGGMTVEETARSEGVSVRTIERDWTRAKAYLARDLAAGGPDDARSEEDGRTGEREAAGS